MIKIEGLQVIDSKGRRYNPADDVSESNLSAYVELRNFLNSGQATEDVVTDTGDYAHILLDTDCGRVCLEVDLCAEELEYEASVDLLHGNPDKQKLFEYLASGLGLEGNLEEGKI